MTDTPKFTIVDRRKFRAEEETSPSTESAAAATRTQAASESYGNLAAGPASDAVPVSGPAAGKGPTLVEPVAQPAKPAGANPAVAVADEPIDSIESIDSIQDAQLPPAPSAEESRFQKAAYDQSAERLDDLVRAQNPAVPAPEKIGFEHLVQQLYLSAMMQMGAGTPEGQRPRIDIIGARQTIDLLGVVLDKTKGNLSAEEERTLQTVLFELRMTFLELTRMISTQPQPPMPPPPGAAKR